jgi:hypothetical protein
MVVRQNRLNLGLLQHDFGNPDVVGIGCLSPGQVPMICHIPANQRFA